MRTAVVRVDVDPTGELVAAQLSAGMSVLAKLAAAAGGQLIHSDLATMPPRRREIEILMAGVQPGELQDAAISMCAKAFGTDPVAGVLTWVSHGTDEDARGVLAGFGLTGEVERVAGEQGWDIINVTLSKDDLTRVPESRVYTALEASTNCEIRIRTV